MPRGNPSASGWFSKGKEGQLFAALFFFSPSLLKKHAINLLLAFQCVAERFCSGQW
jgi:hypothetical protein